MELKHIDIEHLSVSAINMRQGKRRPCIKDILPSIKKRGLIVPLLVRRNGKDDTYEIVAGKRRYFAAKAAAIATSLPCMIMAETDDAEAMEASIIENVARLDADPLTEFEAFAKLSKAGRSVDDIAETFAVAPETVKQRLALGKLKSGIRSLFRSEQIDAQTLRILTLASPAQQAEWLESFKADPHTAARGTALKRWILGGGVISVDNALFDLNAYSGTIVSDLFGENAYFDDAQQFWSLQNAAIAAAKTKYEDAGWPRVTVIGIDEHFASWNYAPCAKDDDGEVVIDVHSSGEVTIHEGLLSHSALRRRQAQDPDAPKPKRSELTNALSQYLAGHRTTIVQAELANAPETALRLIAAIFLSSTKNVRAMADQTYIPNEATRQSIESSEAATAFSKQRAKIADKLGFPFEPDTLVGQGGSDASFADFFRTVSELTRQELDKLLAVLIAETLRPGSIETETAGLALNIDAASWWQPDGVFTALLRAKPAINAMIGELGGSEIAAANIAETRKAQLAIVEAYLTGNGRAKVDGWLPGYLAFPFRAYTEARGGELHATSRLAYQALHQD